MATVAQNTRYLDEIQDISTRLFNQIGRDAMGIITQWNQQMQNLTDQEVQDVLGASFTKNDVANVITVLTALDTSLKAGGGAYYQWLLKFIKRT